MWDRGWRCITHGLVFVDTEVELAGGQAGALVEGVVVECFDALLDVGQPRVHLTHVRAHFH